MGYRQRVAKPSVALWMLVAIGDLVLILAGIGMIALIMLAGVATVAVAAAGTWLLVRRATPQRERVSARVTVPLAARRRA